MLIRYSRLPDGIVSILSTCTFLTALLLVICGASESVDTYEINLNSTIDENQSIPNISTQKYESTTKWIIQNESTHSTFNETPDSAINDVNTNVLPEVSSNDNNYAELEVYKGGGSDVEDYIDSEWNDNGIPSGSTIISVNYYFRHYEDSTTNPQLTIRWWEGTEWTLVCDPSEILSEQIYDCNLTGYINTVAKANDVKLKYRWYCQKSGSYSYKTYLDYEYLTIVYNQPPSSNIKIYNSSLTEKTVFSITENVTIRADVTDADGASDITGVNITIINPDSTVMKDNVPMTNISSITNGYVYEYNYTEMPDDSTSTGTWNVIIYSNDNYHQSSSSTTFSAYRYYLTVNTNATKYYVNNTVLINGIVTNLSDNTAISGAVVNISITYPNGSLANFSDTTTNSLGQYSTTYTLLPEGLTEGTYTVNVNTSDDLGDITTNSITFEVVIRPNIRVVTNRYVILDDPNSGSYGIGYSNPPYSSGKNWWDGETTTVRGYALVLNTTGMPAIGNTVTFTLKKPDQAILDTSTNMTDSHGIAVYSCDLDGTNYYGEWALSASATADNLFLNETAVFVYDWWGCAKSGCHGAAANWNTPPSNYGNVDSKSPYLTGYDKTHTNHKDDTNDCVQCHRSYGDTNYYPSGKHFDKNQCTDCHGFPYNNGNGIPYMYSCYDQSCHASTPVRQNSNLTEISTFETRSEYSGNPVSPGMAHSYYVFSYADLWDMPADLPAPTDFDSGLNYSANTFNNSTIPAGDDGWDWSDGEYETGAASWVEEKWVSADDNPFASNGAIMIELDTYSGDHSIGSPGETIRGAFGIQINVTQELYDILTNGGVAEVSFKYAAWDTDFHYSSAGSDNGCEEDGVIKARFGNNSIMYWLGTNADGGQVDAYPDVAFYEYAKEDSAYITAVYNVTDYINAAGWYYLELGAIQEDWNDDFEEGRRFYFDDVALYFYKSEPAVACIICHNPMHNITNPDSNAQTTSYTEDSHCTVCHKAMNKHDNEVGCTVCHSQDSHIKAYFNSEGSYSGDAGDCSVCHEDELFNTLLNQPKAGLYTGPALDLLIPSPSTHSDSGNAGQLWGDYWYNREQMCIYCHSESYHTIDTAGRIEEFKGDSIYNGLISSSSFWCGKCHYAQNPDYMDMVNAFNSSNLAIPPEITGNNTYWDNSTKNIILEQEPYVNHSAKQYDVNYSDDECKRCHGLMSMTRSDQFHHKVLVGSIGGSDCVDPVCHGGTALINNAPYVNYTILKASIHKDINSNATYTQTLTDEINKACWACHANGTETDHRGLRPESYRCKDCHFINRTTQGEAFNKYYPIPNPNVTEHIEYSIDIKTNDSGNGTCYGCHNNSINSSHGDPDATNWSRISHYGTSDTLMTQTINSTNCTYCHIDIGQTSDNETLRQMWGTPPTINSSDASNTHYHENYSSDCYPCHMSTGEMPYSFHQLEMRRDQVSPWVNITSPINTTYLSNSIYLNYTVNKTTWNEYYKLNNMDNVSLIEDNVTVNGDRNFTITVPNGNHTITVYAEDVSGNIGNGVMNFTINVPDTEPPTTTITSLSDPVAGYRTIIATVTDNTSIIVNATYYMDNSTYWGGSYNSGNITMNVVDGVWDELTESVTALFDTSVLEDGNYTIYVRGQDQNNSWSDFDFLNFTVASYSVNITITPESQSVLQGSDVQYTVTVKNTGSNLTDTIDLTMSITNDYDFEANLVQTSFSLASGASDTTVLIITAKSDVDGGVSTVTSITGTSNGDGSVTGSDNCTTTVTAIPQGLKVTTNRYVILDDPASWGSDDWNGESTTIRAYILVLNDTGMPDIGAAVNISLQNPEDIEVNTTDTTTGSSGIATYSYNMNNQNNWGTWTINVTTSTCSTTTSFKYNQWGCSRCHRWYRNPAAYEPVTPNSPYLIGYDKMHGAKKHKRYVWSNDCLYCHQSYGTGSAGSQYPDGNHKYRQTCQDCHDNDFTSGNGIPDMRSCYEASCHPHKNTELTSFSTVNSSQTDSNSNSRVNYSDTPPAPTGDPCRAHDPDRNVFCIQCHNPMHTIIKPDMTGSSYDYTEDLHCITCHKPRTEHNGSVNCTICHSQDAHKIMFFNDAGSFNQEKVNAGNCSTCHQDGIWDTLLSCSNVLVYDGSSAPSVPKPLNHSDNTSAGERWGTYWTDDLSACEYCHGDTYHLSNALGRLSYWMGNNTINSSLDSNSTWCAGCHYMNYSSGSGNYISMVTRFTNDGLSVPPEITSGAYAPNTTSGFYEHVFTDNYSDQLCRECHEKKVSVSSNVTSFMHNLTEGDCENCHYDAVFMINRGKSDKFVNSTMYEASVHGNRGNIWCWDCHLTSNHPDPEYYWKWCECCHSHQTNPIVDKDRHNVTNSPSTYFVGGTDVLNITDCTTCHDAAKYNNAVNNATQNCRYCHDVPDKGNKTVQSWY